MPKERQARSPRSKEELVNKMLSYDFDGDIRKLGEGVSIVRTRPNQVRLSFPDSGRVFDLTVHMPREEQRRVSKPKAHVREEWEERVEERLRQ